MVNTFAAGGTADVLTRLVADQLSATFKQQFFVETRAGAAGTIGVKSVADSPPDGYNFALTNITHLVLAPISNPKLGYDPQARSHQHRLCRRLADRALGQRQRRHQDAEGLHRAGPQDRQAADLFVVRRRQLRATGGGGFRQEGRHQDRARALQGRVAGPDRSGRRPHRVLGADRVVHRGAGARRPASRDRAFAARRACRTSRTCRPSRNWATTSSPPPGSRISGPAEPAQGHHREGQPRDRPRRVQARGAGAAAAGRPDRRDHVGGGAHRNTSTPRPRAGGRCSTSSD